MVEIFIQPECLHIGQSLKEKKANNYKWFTKEHFGVSILLFIAMFLQSFVFYTADKNNMNHGFLGHR